MKNLQILFLLLALIGVAFTEKDYTAFVKDLAAKIQIAPFKHSAYERLAYLSDTYGPRMWGSMQLEQAIYEMANMATLEGFERVRLEPVKNFTKWVRGNEKLTMTAPRDEPTKLDMIGLGGSVSGNIEADVIVFKTFEEMKAAGAEKIKGKIVCFNNKWIDYENSVAYRTHGGSNASQYGAVGMLVRSVASDSVSSVHTGYMEYDEAFPKIPCAAITVEDAEMFQRMQDRGQTIRVILAMENYFDPNTYSNNIVFELVGTTFPDQIVLAGGHIDSWDTGSQTGANDDGGGFITVFEAIRLLKKSGYRPKRTIRFIAWSGEESGSPIDGAAQYVKLHQNQISKHVAAFQSDLGSTKLKGFGYTGKDSTIVKQILAKYLSILQAGNYSNDGYSADVQPLNDLGVPIFNNMIEDTPDHSFYFRYHHSAGDSMTMMNPDDMDTNVVGIAALLYIIADLDKTVRDVPLPNLTFDV